MDFVLPELPYPQKALEPVISAKTVHHHYDKHHAGYLKKLDDALKGDERNKSLEHIIVDSHDKNPGVFNPAAQVWNHTFYWESMTPETSSLEDKALRDLIDTSFGSLDDFKTKFKDAALGQFGSGWAWLVFDQDKSALSVMKTLNAENPIPLGYVPLLTIDVWEHAYYLDYQQDRGKYVDGFLDKLINWQFAADNLNNTDWASRLKQMAG